MFNLLLWLSLKLVSGRQNRIITRQLETVRYLRQIISRMTLVNEWVWAEACLIGCIVDRVQVLIEVILGDRHF